MRNPIILMVVLLPLYTGCMELSSLKMTQDRPEDIQQLLEHNEFPRVRKLTEKYPAADTPELQTRISMLEIAYENSIYTDAHKLEYENELFGAVKLLSNALQNMPNSNRLREYRNKLEDVRLEKIKINERQQMIARAEYILNQRIYYQQQHNLQAPNLIQRWEQARNDKELEILSAQLMGHGKYAFEHDNLQTAQQYLQLSMKLNDNPEARELLDLMKTTIDSHQEVAEQQASVKKEKKQSRIKKSQAQKSGRLLEETRQAFSDNDLVAARALFMQIPSPENSSKEARILREKLDLAVNTRVTQLAARGDTEYRADDVIRAIKTWSEALKLDPKNQSLKERLDRAERVLAKLEQIKQLQGK